MEAIEYGLRWRLILGESGAQEDEEGEEQAPPLPGGEAEAMDAALSVLYDSPGDGGRWDERSLQVHRWLGDIRKYFPTPVVQLMQRDALERLGLTRMLLEPELLEMVVPNVHLVQALISLSQALPDESRESARALVRRYAEELLQRLRSPMVQTVRGSLYKLSQTRRPKGREIDWPRTIQANLKHYQPRWKTVIPERMFGHRRSARQLRHLFLLLDQSGSMGCSVVHAGILGSVLASLPALDTRLVVFDTEVVDLSHLLYDPVELLFATRLGGGTQIGQALAYARQSMEQPGRSILVLLSDLMEGGPSDELLAQAQALSQSGVQVIVLLSLDDEGAPAYDRQTAARLAALGIPAFACTPDRFPELMAAALENRDLGPLEDSGKGIVRKN
jgi:uncharacterized protein with von Willebrand factor type A (vWA) domain